MQNIPTCWYVFFEEQAHEKQACRGYRECGEHTENRDTGPGDLLAVVLQDIHLANVAVSCRTIENHQGRRKVTGLLLHTETC